MAEMQDMMMKVIRITILTHSEKAKRVRKEVGKEEERAARAKVKAMENAGTAGKRVIEQLTVPRKEEEKEGSHIRQVSSGKEEEKGSKENAGTAEDSGTVGGSAPLRREEMQEQ